MRWIESSVTSILTQTYPAFELIIVDSGSTDATIEWVRSLHDERIKIYQTDKRLDIVENWQRFATIPRSKFMTIIGHDDILYPEYLDTVDKLIERYPDAGLYQTHFNLIDRKGNLIRRCVPMKDNYSPAEFLESVLQHKIEITATGFMMRSDNYDAIEGIPPYPKLLYADTELWIKLILNSYVVVAPEACFEFRFHIDNTSKSSGQVRLFAFEKMVEFFNRLKMENPEFKLIIERDAEAFLKNYAVGSCHKLIYVPKTGRDSVTMDKIAGSAKKCAEKLIPGVHFEPGKFFGIRMAKMIDSNGLLRRLFLIYKSFNKRTF